MSVSVRYHRDVFSDIDEIVDYIAKDNLEAALRFAPAVTEAIRRLSEVPGSGGPRRFKNPRLAGIRSSAIRGFRNHLILYRQDPDGAVRILTVTHGARNLPGLLLRKS